MSDAISSASLFAEAIAKQFETILTGANLLLPLLSPKISQRALNYKVDDLSTKQRHQMRMRCLIKQYVIMSKIVYFFDTAIYSLYYLW